MVDRSSARAASAVVAPRATRWAQREQVARLNHASVLLRAERRNIVLPARQRHGALSRIGAPLRVRDCTKVPPGLSVVDRERHGRSIDLV